MQYPDQLWNQGISSICIDLILWNILALGGSERFAVTMLPALDDISGVLRPHSLAWFNSLASGKFE